MNRNEIQMRAFRLLDAYKTGKLGGERMPEHENPGLAPDSRENYMFFTLPMALNFQRNSYALWQCANLMYADPDARVAFDSRIVCEMPENVLREYLARYKVALQPNRHTATWRRLCETIATQLDGDIRNLFAVNGNSVARIKEYIAARKKAFPCLGGVKICNYWLHVIEQYTDMRFTDRQCITIAPDTHVIQASLRLGVITEAEALQSDVQTLVAERWRDILRGTGVQPIDMHTPLWLWSRGKFSIETAES